MNYKDMGADDLKQLSKEELIEVHKVALDGLIEVYNKNKYQRIHTSEHGSALDFLNRVESELGDREPGCKKCHMINDYKMDCSKQ